MATSTIGEQRLAQHTPGPWVADSFCTQDDAVVRVGTNDGTATYYHRTKTICECWVREDEGDDDSPHILQAEANARLIAAAPDLLALAKQYASECAECCGTGISWDWNAREQKTCSDCADIYAVIAKAEGR
jgi:hypothetical protein